MLSHISSRLVPISSRRTVYNPMHWGPDDEIDCPLDADGAHQPVRVDEWSDDPGPLEDGAKVWDRMFYNLNTWGLKHYAELFRYLEPSLFGGALQPTDSLIVMKQLMERCFSYNTGAVAVE